MRLSAFVFVSFALLSTAQSWAEETRSNHTFFRLAQLEIDPSFMAKSHRESVDAFPVHKDGAFYDMEAEDYLQVRLGLTAKYEFKAHVYVKLDYEQDLISRRIAGGSLTEPSNFVQTDGSTPGGTPLRVMNLEFRYQGVAVSSGFAVSNWGLGLLANDGRRAWQPKSANFGSAYGGDRVYRTRLVIGPIPALQSLLLLTAYDTVIEDDILVDTDTAKQFITAMVLRPGQPNTIGIYGAFRTQKHEGNKTTEVAAYDIFARYTASLDKKTTLKLEGEAALIVGTTDLGPNPSFVEHDILQAAALLRLNLSHQTFGFIGDLLYASGDQNTDDDQINNFRIDPNFESGLILYRHVLNGSTGHGPVAAADPDLVGYPSEDLERLANNRSISNTVSFFPKLWWQLGQNVEAYGGVLFAFSEVSQIDPRNARLAGGENRNAFDEVPGGYLGTEYDIGLRYSPKIGPMSVSFGAEYGHFVFGDAFTSPSSIDLSPINAARLYVRSAL